MSNKNPEKEREYQRNYRKGHLEQRRKADREWKKNHPEQNRENHRRYIANHPEKRKQYSDKYRRDGRMKAAQIKHRYGITIQKVGEIRNKQSGLCPICSEPLSYKALVIDHSHETGEVRGIIHRTCNFMIGLAKDNPEILEKAANYLRKDRAR